MGYAVIGVFLMLAFVLVYASIRIRDAEQKNGGDQHEHEQQNL